jgi:hypothetical protein
LLSKDTLATKRDKIRKKPENSGFCRWVDWVSDRAGAALIDAKTTKALVEAGNLTT